MALLTQSIINGLITGSIYALVAAGYSLIYSTNNFMHFAHGISVVAAGYMVYWFFSLAGMPFYITCLITIILSAIFGLAMYRLIYLPLQKKEHQTSYS